MRAVSLLPAATDIIVALGAVEALVGVSHECDAAAVAALPRVTSTPVDREARPAIVDADVRRLSAGGAPLFTVDERAIAGLRPDVLFTQSLCDVCAVREEDVRALARRLTPPARVVTLGAQTLDGVLEDVAHVSEALDGEGEPEELIAGLRARLRRVHERLAVERAPRPRAAVLEWTDPSFAAGHWVPDLVRRAGAIDVLADAGGHSRERTPAEFQAAEPDVLLVAPCGYSLSRAIAAATDLVARPEWAWAAGCALWAIDANRLVSRPGPGLVDGALTMASIFHPSLFPAPDAERARRVTVA